MMLYRIRYFYIIALIMGLGLQFQQSSVSSSYIYRKNPVQIKLRRFFEPLKEKLSTNHYDLLLAYITGYKKKMNENLKLIHQDLNLRHLFTPSGLHFSALIFPLFMLFKNFTLRIIFLLALYFVFFKYSCQYSINRVITFYVITLTAKRLNRPLDIRLCFLLTFLFDYAFGTYLSSPLSWYYSFLFWGTLVYSSQAPKILMPVFFFASLCICQVIAVSSFYPLSLPFQIFLTGVFSFLFPFILLFACLSHVLPITFALSFLLKIYSFFLEYSHNLVLKTPEFTLSHEMLVLFFLPFHRLRKDLKIGLILVIALASPAPLGLAEKNHQSYLFRYKYISLPERKDFVSKKIVKQGFMLKFKGGVTCYHKVADSRSLYKCNKRFSKRKLSLIIRK